MDIRSAFTAEIRSLEDQLLIIADLCGSALRNGIEALVNYDTELAQSVVDGDEEINQRWAAFEQEVMEVIARQNPMASDLRELLSMSAIVTDLERIGDHAKRLAIIARDIAKQPASEALVTIPRMAEIADSLLSAQITAFINGDVQAAQEIAARDSEIDALYRLAYRDLITSMQDNPQAAARVSLLMTAAKSIERIGDHVTNIGERVVFLKTGELVELNG